MTLFDECVEALGKDIKIIDNSEQIALIDIFLEVVPFTRWGLIEWKSFKKLNTNLCPDDLSDLKSKKFYIIWDTKNPSIECVLGDILDNLDDVLCVSLHTWLFATDMDIVIEFYRGNDIKMGNIDDVI